MKREAVVTFDGSFDGFLCIIYAYYYENILPSCIISEHSEQQLTISADEYHVITDIPRAKRVQKGIITKISQEAFNRAARAFLSCCDERYINIFYYIIYGFKVGASLDDHMHQENVHYVHKLSRQVGREAHLLVGFCRFAETKEGVLYSSIAPENNVLQILAEHFSDRFLNENWVIHDKKRNIAAIYNRNEYIIVDVPKDTFIEFKDNELDYQRLWKIFFVSLAIEERKNYKLQRGMLPKKFRKWMTEFV